MARNGRVSHFRFWPADYLNDRNVIVMNCEERGIYSTLLFAAWDMERPGVLPNHDHALMRLARATPEEWERCKPAVSMCFQVTDSEWVQKRLASEFAAQDRAWKRYRQAGKAGGRLSAELRASQVDGKPTSPEPQAGLELGSTDSPGSPGSPGSPEKKKTHLSGNLSGFGEFYDDYPRPLNRAAAAKAYAKARARHPSLTDDDLPWAAREFAGEVTTARTEQKYIPHPTTWLNQDRFLEHFDAGRGPHESDS